MIQVNKKQWQYLEGVHEKEKLSHAYLFAGPEGVGKFDLAIDFVELFNDSDQEKIEAGSDPDVFLIQPEIEKKKKIRKKDISIDQIKEAAEKIKFHAYQSKFKVLLIKEPERMTTVAANSLLKLIEEPKEDTKTILISNKEQSVLPTIRSRCQIIRFGLGDKKEIEKTLKKEFPEEKSELISSCVMLSRGRVDFARKYVEDREKRGEAQRLQEDFRGALRSGLLKGFDFAAELGDDKVRLLEAMDEWIWYLREFLKERISQGESREVTKKIHQILKDLVRLKSETENTNANQKMQLENFFVQLS